MQTVSLPISSSPKTTKVSSPSRCDWKMWGNPKRIAPAHSSANLPPTAFCCVCKECTQLLHYWSGSGVTTASTSPVVTS